MIPVLLVGYKRVVELSELLQKSLECGVSRVYIAIDAIDSEPENPITHQFKSKIAKIANDYPGSEIKIWIRSQNLGSSLSVLSAIEWAFQFEESLVILEDDLVISAQLLEFFATQLKLLDLDPKLLMVSGSNPFRGISKSELSGYSHYPVVWGWATTRGKWAIIKGGIFKNEYIFVPKIGLKVKNFLETGRTRALSRQIDAWDVPLAAFMRAHDYKCLIPNSNLVSNIGYDRHATHTTSQGWPLGVEIEELQITAMNFTQNYDEQMETLVLRIKRRHILSKIKLAIFSILKFQKIQYSLLLDDFLGIEIPNSGEYQ